jgi:hypothetical protein
MDSHDEAAESVHVEVPTKALSILARLDHWINGGDMFARRSYGYARTALQSRNAPV